MSLENDKIILQEADIEGVGDLVQRAQNRLIVDHDDNKMDKVPAAPTGELAEFDSAGQVIASGKKASDKMDKLTNATAGHAVEIEPNGNVTDAGFTLSSIAPGYKHSGITVPPIVGGEKALAIGNNAIGNVDNAVAIGTDARVDNESGTAIGDDTRVQGDFASAIGANVENSDAHSAMLGYGNSIDVNQSVVHTKDKGRLHLLGDNAAYNVPEYTVATVPTGGEGDLIYVTDGDAGSKCLAFHDGTSWKVIALGAAISAT